MSGAPARADVQLRTGIRGEAAWNSNVLAEEEDEQGDVSFRTTPWFELEDDRGDLQWDLGYRPSYEAFVREEDLSGWDHDVRGGLSWRVRPDTTITVDDRFVRFESITRFNESVGVDDVGQPITETRGRLQSFKRNEADIGIEHRLSPTRTLSLRAAHTLFDFSSENRSDRQNASVTLGYQHSLSEPDVLGAFVSWRRQTFEDPGGGERRTDFYNVSLAWTHQFDPTFQFRISGGPTLVDPQTAQTGEQATLTVARFPGEFEPGLQGGGVALRSLFDIDTCPTLEDGTPVVAESCEPVSPRLLVAGNDRSDFETVELGFDDQPESESDINFFADVSVSKRWEQWFTELSYQRREDAAGGVGFSAIADTVRGNVVWTPSPRWRFQLVGTWLRQTQSSEALLPAVALRPDELTALGLALDPLGGVRLVPNTDVAAEAFALRGVPTDNDFEQTQISVAFTATYELTRRISLVGRLFYIDVDQERDLGGIRSFDRFRASFGVSYEFDPIRL